jgi:mRNA interferase RelE/StbE
MAYRIEFSPAAERQFKKLPKEIQLRLKPRLDGLMNNPFPRGAKKLSGEENIYRLRVGDHRIIYQVQQETLLVLVVKLGHRKEIYRRISGS